MDVTLVIFFAWCMCLASGSRQRQPIWETIPAQLDAEEGNDMPGETIDLQQTSEEVETEEEAETDREAEESGKREEIFYCFGGFMSETVYDLELFQTQYHKGTGVFACGIFDLFSDEAVQVGVDYMTVQVQDKENEFYKVKDKWTGSWMTTGFFKQVWRAVLAKGHYRVGDWVVKVDAATVFIPDRLAIAVRGLRAKLPKAGAFLDTCDYYSNSDCFSGSLEVYSEKAFNTLAKNLDMCSGEIDWQGKGKEGLINESQFAQRCLRLAHVKELSGLWSVAGPQGKMQLPPCNSHRFPAFYPLKGKKEYEECLEAVTHP